MLEAITSSTTAAQSPNATRVDDQKSQFLQLLIAQIKGQDPMNPMDGTQFVAQLAQFSSLEELINVRKATESVQKAIEQQTAALAGAMPETNGSDIFGAGGN